jgi:hypothetical protein
MNIAVWQTGVSLESQQSQLSSSPVLLVQSDEIGGTVASVKVAIEGKLFEAGLSITEGLDRVFKAYWIFNMQYPDKSANVFKFFEYYVYKMQTGKKNASHSSRAV